MTETSKIDASPTKAFFVDMLTRDIELEDAILDLLDNCVDGIQRSIKQTSQSNSSTPYQGFWAKISFDENRFIIEDNCGGIPLGVAQNYAFRMGRPAIDSDKELSINAIGTYGIGMKRAIFKMGVSSEIKSQTANDSFRVNISEQWISDPNNWELTYDEIERSMDGNGARIEVTNLREPIKEQFSSSTSTFANKLVGRISHNYSYIIAKGFRVYVNNKNIESLSIQLLWERNKIEHSPLEKCIAPYIYQTTYEDISIQLAVGFYRKNFVTDEEIEQENEGNRKTSDNAGWTIICNDRIVVYSDKTRLTGWGEAKVPSYHPQFISIAGIVHFRCPDPRKLPITTTKRGLDLSSDVYLRTKDFMREGLKLFTNYTNKWKKDLAGEKEIVKHTEFVDLQDIFTQIEQRHLWKERKDGSKYYQPSLPLPESQQQERGKTIRFSRKKEEVKTVAEYLFEDEDRSADEVGNECFEKVLKEAQEA
jgi:hypothetical protein